MVAAMNEHRKVRIASLSACAALALLLPACGGAVVSGVAVGKVGQDLSGHAHTAPQGAEVCALQDALVTPPGGGGTEKPTSDACNKVLKTDQLWRRSMIVLAAYGNTLGSVASGTSADTAGQLEAATTGVSGGDWIDVDGAKEKAAKDAVAQLVAQMGATSSKGDLAKVIKDAAPHVKTICDGLVPYLEAQGKSLGDLQKEVEKKRVARADRRCGNVDSRSICVQESVIDRYVYANVYSQAALLEQGHLEARDAAATFCAAHAKLEAAANNGDLSKDKTYQDIVEAAKSARQGKGGASSKAPPKK
jgi:hypothetical protein